MGHDTTTGDGGLDDRVQLVVTTNGQQQVARGDAVVLLLATVAGLLALLLVHLAAGVAGQLQDLGGEVLQQGGAVDGSGAGAALLAEQAVLHAAVDAADGEVEASGVAAVDDGHLGAALTTSLALALSLSLALTLALAAALTLGTDALAVLATGDDAGLLTGGLGALHAGQNGFLVTSDSGHDI